MAVWIKNVNVGFDGDEAEAREVVAAMAFIVGDWAAEPPYPIDMRVAAILEEFAVEMKAALGRPAEDRTGTQGAAKPARRRRGKVPHLTVREEPADQQAAPTPSPAPLPPPPMPAPLAVDLPVERVARPRYAGEESPSTNPYRRGRNAPVPQDPVPVPPPTFRKTEVA